LVANPGFEDQPAGQLLVTSRPFIGEDSRISIINDGTAHNGSQCAIFPGDWGGQLMQRVPVAPYTSYRFRVWVNGTPGGMTGGVQVTGGSPTNVDLDDDNDAGYDGTPLLRQVIIHPVGGWQEVSFLFNSGSDVVVMIRMSAYFTDDGQFLRVDDMS